MQAMYRYKYHLPEPSVGVMLAGRVVHAVLEGALTSVILGKGLPSAKDLDDHFAVAWAADVQKEEARDGFSGWVWNEGDPEKIVREESRGLVRMAREEILPNIRPRFVEHKFNYELPSAAGPFRIYGVIDLLEEDGAMVDWKTVDKISQNAKGFDVQFPGYSIYVSDLLKEPVTKARKIFLVRGKRKPCWEVSNYNVLEHQRTWFAEVAAEVWRTIQADVWLPNTGGWIHSAKFCSFWNTCPCGASLESPTGRASDLW
jgi:hypothetical protein